LFRPQRHQTSIALADCNALIFAVEFAEEALGAPEAIRQDALLGAAGSG